MSDAVMGFAAQNGGLMEGIQMGGAWVKCSMRRLEVGYRSSFSFLMINAHREYGTVCIYVIEMSQRRGWQVWKGMCS